MDHDIRQPQVLLDERARRFDRRQLRLVSLVIATGDLMIENYRSGATLDRSGNLSGSNPLVQFSHIFERSIAHG